MGCAGDRLDHCPGCAPSSPVTEPIPGKDGAHPGRSSVRPPAAVVRVTELHQQRPIFLSAEAAVGKYEQMTFYCNKKDIRFFVKYITLQLEKCMVKKAENQWGE